MFRGVEIIAEVKTQSPFGWTSSKSWDELFNIAEPIADVLSIHTDVRWGGSFDLIKKAKKYSDKQILAKGIHTSDDEVKRALDAGADKVLVVGRIPDIEIDKCLIEPLTIEELSGFSNEIQAVWNSRDLKTGGMKNESYEEARKIFSGWLCQASNIKTIADIKNGADAVLVGTHIEQFSESVKSI